MTDFEMRGNMLYKYHGKGGDVVIPDGVTEIYICAFSGRSDITSITFPPSLVKIGERAFQYCKGLTALDFPPSLKEIGRQSFDSCTGLTEVVVPPSVIVLDFYAFHDCSALTHISAPANVLSQWPFPKTIESAELNGGTSLSKDAFKDFLSLRSVTIANTVRYIGEGAFSQCARLEKITIPDSVTDIAERAFAGCIALSEVALGASLYHIKEKAFSDCTALTSIRIPASATMIEQNAFVGCTALTSCTFEDTDRWCHIPPNKYWAPYENVVEPDVDLTNPQANALVVTDLASTILFKKRAVPRTEPEKARILTPVAKSTENGLFVQGRYFAPLMVDEATLASIHEQASQLSLAHTEVTSHDHDEYGRYTDVETKYYPLSSLYALTAPLSGENGDLIVEDGKLTGIVFCRFFRGWRDPYEEYFIDLPRGPKDEGSHIIILWADGSVEGDNEGRYSDHSGRDYTDSTTEYKLTRASNTDKAHHAHWD